MLFYGSWTSSKKHWNVLESKSKNESIPRKAMVVSWSVLEKLFQKCLETYWKCVQQSLENVGRIIKALNISRRSGVLENTDSRRWMPWDIIFPQQRIPCQAYNWFIIQLFFPIVISNSELEIILKNTLLENEVEIIRELLALSLLELLA